MSNFLDKRLDTTVLLTPEYLQSRRAVFTAQVGPSTAAKLGMRAFTTILRNRASACSRMAVLLALSLLLPSLARQAEASLVELATFEDRSVGTATATASLNATSNVPASVRRHWDRMPEPARDPDPSPFRNRLESPASGEGMVPSGHGVDTGSTVAPAVAFLGEMVSAPPMLVVWLSYQQHLFIPPAPRSGLLRPPKSA